MSEPSRPRRPRLSQAVWLFLVLILLGLVALLVTNDVSTALTEDDKAYAERALRETGHGDLVGRKPATDFDDQIHAILAVQDAVLTIAPENVGIPLGEPREPRDLYEAKRGLCFDRSRAIEKILSHLGFEVRHAAVYSTKETGSRLKAFVTPRTPSHAVTEVKTARGWLVIDSNRRWVGLTSGGAPVDLGKLQDIKLQDVESKQQTWDPQLKEAMSPILAGPFTYLYGLYSRHGRFYPPYTPIPDADWGQIGYNITG
jgi:hypothetical protein